MKRTNKKQNRNFDSVAAPIDCESCIRIDQTTKSKLMQIFVFEESGHIFGVYIIVILSPKTANFAIYDDQKKADFKRN